MKLLLLATLATTLAHTAELRIGLIGCDTSHATAFAEILNNPAAKNHVPGARVVAAVKASSPDVESSHTRVEGYAATLREKYGVTFHDTIEAMCATVDAVLIVAVDGRPHLAQARPVIAAKKPLFIDKPIAAGLRDTLAIAQLARDSGVPVWTGSSYRWYPTMRELLAADIGEIRAAISFGPAHLEPHHMDFAWYAVHPLEALYTVMGQGCESVSRTKTADTDIAAGLWKNGRTGTLVGLRTKSMPHQVTTWGTKGWAQQKPTTHDYAPLVAEIVKFLQTGKSPVPMEETVEMFAFMAAADESARRGGAHVKLSEMIEAAK